MKTIILTSGSPFARIKLRPSFLGLLPKEPAELKVLHITTASEVVEDNWYSKNDTRIIRELGFDVQEYDIAGKGPDEIKKALNGKDIVYVQGGNGFWLLKQSRESGFGEIIKELVESGKIIYIGKSAGTFLACPTVEIQKYGGGNWKTFELTDLSALNMVPFLVKAHYTDDQREQVAEIKSKVRCPVRVLRDTQAFVVEDEEVRLIGEGAEVII
jgi:dipeptidase E